MNLDSTTDLRKGKGRKPSMKSKKNRRILENILAISVKNLNILTDTALRMNVIDIMKKDIRHVIVLKQEVEMINQSISITVVPTRLQ